MLRGQPGGNLRAWAIVAAQRARVSSVILTQKKFQPLAFFILEAKDAANSRGEPPGAPLGSLEFGSGAWKPLRLSSGKSGTVSCGVQGMTSNCLIKGTFLAGRVVEFHGIVSLGPRYWQIIGGSDSLCGWIAA